MSAETNAIIDLPERFGDLGVTPDQIEAFCRKWRIRELAAFGSVLRDDFGDNSDIDLLVTFEERQSWRDLVSVHDELARMFGRNVDFVKRDLVEASRNRLRREDILASARTIYAA